MVLVGTSCKVLSGIIQENEEVTQVAIGQLRSRS